MKIDINALLAQCILCYSQQFLESTLELALILFILIGTENNIFHVLSLVLTLKQQFIERIKWEKLNKLTLKIEPTIFTTIKLI